MSTHICSCFFNRAYIWNPSMEHPFGHRKEVHICRETSAESCCWSFGNTRPPYQHCGSLYFHEWTCPKSKPYMTGSPSKWWFGSQDWFQHFKNLCQNPWSSMTFRCHRHLPILDGLRGSTHLAGIAISRVEGSKSGTPIQFKGQIYTMTSLCPLSWSKKTFRFLQKFDRTTSPKKVMKSMKSSQNSGTFDKPFLSHDSPKNNFPGVSLPPSPWQLQWVHFSASASASGRGYGGRWQSELHHLCIW